MVRSTLFWLVLGWHSAETGSQQASICLIVFSVSVIEKIIFVNDMGEAHFINPSELFTQSPKTSPMGPF